MSVVSDTVGNLQFRLLNFRYRCSNVRKFNLYEYIFSSKIPDNNDNLIFSYIEGIMQEIETENE